MADRYEIAIVGSGPAGLSAAINAKIRNKKFIIFGSRKLSSKLVKAHEVNNYPGFFGKSGLKIADAFKEHLKAMDIQITEQKVTNVYNMGSYYSLLTKEGMYEADAVILASGVNFGQPFKGEKEFLGKGVSYCATCDALFYRGKTAAVIGFSPKDEEEAEFLAQVAKKVYYIPMYKEEIHVDDSIQVIHDQIVKIAGDDADARVEKLILANMEISLDGVFILRESVAADQLIPGLRVEDNHVCADRLMKTNLAGCFAAGDIVGKPYQYIKAAGEGNIAALSAVSYLDEKKRQAF
ncbi:MAG: NAD(P)/FAD-dependent oxidoreductase [Eubacteriales bacterium]|nr:NAD(P)/FAD-dependent oxidoreductase [Eubacteriales bacterium]